MSELTDSATRTRDGYPHGVPCWIDTSQPDPEAAARFYSGVFGWEFADRMPPDAPGKYLVAQLRGLDVCAVGSQPEGARPEARWLMYIWVDSADDAAAKVQEAGGSVLSPPFDVPTAGRMAVFADPSGAEFAVWQASEHKGAQLVNEPATWNFSDLNTSDMEGAKAFYGAVFGWEGDTLDFGGGPSTMWRVPGYGDHLEQRDPGVHERHKEGGAPEGFTDAVAWAQPLSGDAAPHWGVTFTVADADATAERAAQLGGTVLSPPTDMPWVRTATLRDPQGAAFTVSKFVPPAG